MLYKSGIIRSFSSTGARLLDVDLVNLLSLITEITALQAVFESSKK